MPRHPARQRHHDDHADRVPKKRALDSRRCEDASLEEAPRSASRKRKQRRRHDSNDGLPEEAAIPKKPRSATPAPQTPAPLEDEEPQLTKADTPSTRASSPEPRHNVEPNEEDGLYQSAPPRRRARNAAVFWDDEDEVGSSQVDASSATEVSDSGEKPPANESRDGSREEGRDGCREGGRELKKIKEQTRQKKSAPDEGPVYEIKRCRDLSRHRLKCYVCDGELPTLFDVEQAPLHSVGAETLFCDSCVKSFHRECVIEATILSDGVGTSLLGDDSKKWLCPTCLSLPVIRRVSFLPRSGPKAPEGGEFGKLEYYEKFVCGLTGYSVGCGHCGKPSSQSRVAVLCDNCDREWHIECLEIESEEIPWGNWLCPDCASCKLCASCVLRARTDEDREDALAEKPSFDASPAPLYHENDVLSCDYCTLKYHFDCVKAESPKHLAYSRPLLQRKYQQYLERRQEETPDPPTFDRFLSMHSFCSADAKEPWLCPQCQEYLGVQRICDQRRWVDMLGGSGDEEIQLLIKFRSLSYRKMQWLPLNRVKALYHNGVRKWLQSLPAARLMTPGPTTDPDIDELNSDNGNSSDGEEVIGSSSANNSSSVQKLAALHGSEICLLPHCKRPVSVKSDWLLPERILDRRRCSRGTTRLEFLVKWFSLSYDEASWEPLQVVLNTRALLCFEACDCLQRVADRRPLRVRRPRDPREDPTVTDYLEDEEDVALPPGSELVNGTRYLVKTVGTSLEEGSSLKMGGSGVSRVQIGSFIPYSDRPKFLKNKYLFDYQLEGINWLRYSWHRSRSVILADEMGLGKTVQVISFLGSLWNDESTQGPFLVVAPLATLEDVWVREFAHWTPFMNVVAYCGNPEARGVCREHELFCTPEVPRRQRGGSSRGSGVGPSLADWIRIAFGSDLVPVFNRSGIQGRLPKQCKASDTQRLAKFDALVTSYELFRRDEKLFREIGWKVIVMDEGHRLKNFSCEVKRALESCESKMRLLLTGTPLQNSVDELFSLLNVLHRDKFPEELKEKYQDVTHEGTITQLKEELQAHILRRTKKDVMGGRMPAKKETIIRVENSYAQKEIYRNIIKRNHSFLGAAITPAIQTAPHSGKAIRVTSLRNIVMQMRKCCNHPYLFEDAIPVIRTDEELTQMVESSGKLKLLDRMLKFLIADGHRILIFSQFMRMLDILEEYLIYKKYGYERLDGTTSAPNRQKAIDRFNTLQKEKFIFLLSTRAGGLGINLTSADTVIIYDSDWNPHNDLQAQARAHRLGQTKKVAIFRFMTRASVEERIIEIARNKLVLDQVVAGKLSPNDVEEIVKCGAKELLESEGSGAREIHYDDDQLRSVLCRDEPESSSTEERGSDRVLDHFKVAHFFDEGDATTPAPVDEAPHKFWQELLGDRQTEATQPPESLSAEATGEDGSGAVRQAMTRRSARKRLTEAQSESPKEPKAEKSKAKGSKKGSGDQRKKKENGDSSQKGANNSEAQPTTSSQSMKEGRELPESGTEDGDSAKSPKSNKIVTPALSAAALNSKKLRRKNRKMISQFLTEDVALLLGSCDQEEEAAPAPPQPEEDAEQGVEKEVDTVEPEMTTGKVKKTPDPPDMPGFIIARLDTAHLYGILHQLDHDGKTPCKASLALDVLECLVGSQEILKYLNFSLRTARRTFGLPSHHSHATSPAPTPAVPITASTSAETPAPPCEEPIPPVTDSSSDSPKPKVEGSSNTDPVGDSSAVKESKSKKKRVKPSQQNQLPTLSSQNCVSCAKYETDISEICDVKIDALIKNVFSMRAFDLNWNLNWLKKLIKLNKNFILKNKNNYFLLIKNFISKNKNYFVNILTQISQKEIENWKSKLTFSNLPSLEIPRYFPTVRPTIQPIETATISTSSAKLRELLKERRQNRLLDKYTIWDQKKLHQSSLPAVLKLLNDFLNQYQCRQGRE